jgi:hypothetical protein
MTLTLPTYLGYPVLGWEPNWSDPSPNADLRQTKFRLDNGSGKVADDAPYTPRPRTARTLMYDFTRRSEVLEAQELLRDVLIGRLMPVWVPLWTDDFKLTAGCAYNERDLFITPIGFKRYYEGVGLGRTHVALFPMASGRDTMLCRAVVANTVEIDGREKITLDSDLGVPLAVSDLVCFLLLCRADSDDLTIEWTSWQTGTLELPVIDLPREVP